MTVYVRAENSMYDNKSIVLLVRVLSVYNDVVIKAHQHHQSHYYRANDMFCTTACIVTRRP